MERHWLLVDLNNEIHRCWHTTGELSHDGKPTGIAYGVLRDIAFWTNKFQTPDIAFCADAGKPLRLKDRPEYKSTRQKKRQTPEEKAIYSALEQQAQELVFETLPALGYGNVFFSNGYEADDLIASTIEYNADEAGTVEFTIISSDKDLYQLLATDVCIFKPMHKEVYTIRDFNEEWGLSPRRWAKLKAIAGCATDDVVGIKGVGEKTAARYLRGELPIHHKSYQAIKESEWKINDNLLLTRLPYSGTPAFKLRDNEASPAKWRKVTEKLGMDSLRSSPPLFS